MMQRDMTLFFGYVYTFLFCVTTYVAGVVSFDNSASSFFFFDLFSYYRACKFKVICVVCSFLIIHTPRKIPFILVKFI